MSTVVIGANFGDEGKGLITDFETRRLNATVVARFNGGAQAGHTVTTKEGQRHVFGHIGSGAFAGASTYLSSKFIFNPLALKKEMAGVRINTTAGRTIFVNQEARTTTIYDMAMNALVELSRGNDRHGSCGLGINETVTRHERYPLHASDVYSAYHPIEDTASILRRIHTGWVPTRLQALGIKEIPEPYASILANDDYLEIARQMRNATSEFVHMHKPTEAYKNFVNGYVFEGAQGLMLDEFLGDFPHVTRSITGLPYAIIAAVELGVKSIKPVYVTRSYLTRHGAGRLPFEGFMAEIHDATNVENPWQGKIRFAPLNLQLLGKFIRADIQRGKHVAQALGVELETPTIAVTCLDQLQGKASYITSYGLPESCSVEDLPAKIEAATSLKISHISRGPTAEDVEYLGE